ncbi:MAG: hypothetical protein Q9170_006123 [Blastenia crenularia]
MPLENFGVEAARIGLGIHNLVRCFVTFFNLQNVKAQPTMIPFSSTTPSFLSAVPNTSFQPASTVFDSQSSSSSSISTSTRTTYNPQTTSLSSRNLLPNPNHSPTTPSPTIPSPTATFPPTQTDTSTNKGLAGGLALTLSLAFIFLLLFAIHKYRHHRRLQKAKARKAQVPRTRDLVPDPLPQHPVETNGYTEWEMATERNAHEADGGNLRRGRRSRLGF